jgi:malonyl-CoA O-methyltransferase
LDSALGMLRVAAGQQSWRRSFLRLHADAEHLPLAQGSVDLIFSNFMLQWCNPDAAFAEFRRVLAPQGFLSFTSLGPDTLRELRAAWGRVDSQSHVNEFIDMHDLGDALVRAGFAAPVLDVERYTLNYTDVRRLAADLKAVGAHNAAVRRSKGLTGRRKFAAMQSAYEAFRHDGRLPATYEVVFGQAWAPAGARRGASEPSTVSLEEIKRQLQTRRGS